MSIRRYIDQDLTAEGLARRVLDDGIDLPTKTTRLEPRDVETRVQMQFGQQSSSIDELYHENSKLTRRSWSTLVGAQRDANGLKNQLLPKQSFFVASDAASVIEFTAVQRSLQALVDAVPLELFYAIEIRMLNSSRLWVFEPVSDRISPYKNVSREDLSQLSRSLLFEEGTYRVGSASNIIILVGRFARNYIMYGSRGYRRTIWEAGRITEAILARCRELGLQATSSFDFFDREVDAVIQADGVEEGVVSLIVVKEQSNAS